MISIPIANSQTLEVEEQNVLEHYAQLIPLLIENDVDDPYFGQILQCLSNVTIFESVQLPESLCGQLWQGIIHLCHKDTSNLQMSLDNLERLDMLHPFSEFLKIALLYTSAEYFNAISACDTLLPKAKQQQLFNLIPSILFLKAMALRHSGKHQQALVLFQHLLRCCYHYNLDSLKIKLLIASSFQLLGMTRESELSCYSILKQYPANGRALHILGILLLSQKKKLGIACLKSALVSLPKDVGILAKLGELFLRSDPNKSKLLFTFVHENAASCPELKFVAAKALGYYYHINMQYDKASKYYKQVRHDPVCMVYHAQLSILHDKSAVSYFHRLTKLEQQHDPIVQLLKSFAILEMMHKIRKYHLIFCKTEEKQKYRAEYKSHGNQVQQLLKEFSKSSNHPFAPQDVHRISGRCETILQNTKDAIEIYSKVIKEMHEPGIQKSRNLLVLGGLLFQNNQILKSKQMMIKVKKDMELLHLNQHDICALCDYNLNRILEESDIKLALQTYEEIKTKELISSHCIQRIGYHAYINKNKDVVTELSTAHPTLMSLQYFNASLINTPAIWHKLNQLDRSNIYIIVQMAHVFLSKAPIAMKQAETAYKWLKVAYFMDHSNILVIHLLLFVLYSLKHTEECLYYLKLSNCPLLMKNHVTLLMGIERWGEAINVIKNILNDSHDIDEQIMYTHLMGKCHIQSGAGTGNLKQFHEGLLHLTRAAFNKMDKNMVKDVVKGMCDIGGILIKEKEVSDANFALFKRGISMMKMLAENKGLRDTFDEELIGKVYDYENVMEALIKKKDLLEKEKEEIVVDNVVEADLMDVDIAVNEQEVEIERERLELLEKMKGMMEVPMEEEGPPRKRQKTTKKRKGKKEEKKEEDDEQQQDVPEPEVKQRGNTMAISSDDDEENK